MQLLWTVVTHLPKTMLNLELKKGIEHDVLDSPYGVCIHYTLLKFTLNSLNTLQYKQDDKLDSLLICNIMFSGSQQILLDRFCALALINPLLPQATLFLTECQAG